MFNLLPYKEKKAIGAEYMRRRLIIILLFSIATVILAGVFLIPSFIIAGYRLSEIKQTVAVLQANDAIKNQQTYKDAIAAANKKIATFGLSSTTEPLLELLEGIAAVKSDAITITSFNASRTGGTLALTVEGTAKDRESLLSFANLLKGSGVYGKVDLPISNFAKDENISFSLNVTTK
jgi:hypothetical protein